MLYCYRTLKCLAIGIFVSLSVYTTLFGQATTPSGKPNRFIPYSIGQSINTSYDELNPVFSPDETTIYFSRTDHPDNHYGEFRSQDIWYAERNEDGTWGEARRVDAPFNENRYNAIYAVTAQGEYLISGVYKKNGTYKKRGFSLVRQTENGWADPVKLKMPKVHHGDKGLVSMAFLSKDGDEMLLSYETSWQRTATPRLRYSQKKNNGKTWKAPKVVAKKTLGKKFGSVEAPSLSEDGLSLYFSATKKKSSSQNDIYRMSRNKKFQREWKALEKADTVVNSPHWDNYYKRFNEDNWAVFARAEVGDDADIFVVKLHEPKPYVDLKGTVLLAGQPFSEDFEIMINGQVVDSVRIDTATARYAVQLPLGKRYEVQAKAAKKVATIAVIDASEEREYWPLEKDLELSLLPFLDLAGTVTVNGVPFGKAFEIFVNGRPVDSVEVDTLSARYAVKLPLGEQYTLEVRSANYIAGRATVDVTAEQRQIHLEQALELTPLPYVDISGQLYNTATKNTVPATANPKVLVNGLEVDSLKIINGMYKVRLPWGRKYTLQALVEEFAPTPVAIDLVNINSYRHVRRDLFVSPLEKHAVLTGKVINMKTMAPITESFVIEVNGARSANSEVDSTTGAYKVRLSLGQRATLTGRADKYFPISEVIDLIDETETIKMIKDLQMMPLEVGASILLNNIFFEVGSTNLKPDSYADIDRVTDLLRQVPTLKIEIAGHTDSSGKDEFNLALSNSRAKSVAQYIYNKGLGDDRVVYKGYGEAKPVASNLTAEGRSKNRRVEFKVLEK